MYTGSLNMDKMTFIQKRGYKSWIDERQRCNNHNNPMVGFLYGNNNNRISEELNGTRNIKRRNRN